MRRFDLACIVVALAFATHAAAGRACTGDCGTRGLVGVGDLMRAVTIALGEATLDSCTAIDADADGSASVSELVAAVGNALDGCPTVIDQRWEGPVGSCDKPSTIYQILAHQPFGQEFTPTRPLLGAAEVYVRAAAPPYTGTLTLNVHLGAIDGPLLGSVSRLIPIDAGPIAWQRFVFAPPLALEPGGLYVIEMMADSAVLMWLTDMGFPPCDPDAYHGGRGILLGKPFDNDAYFRTLAID